MVVTMMVVMVVAAVVAMIPMPPVVTAFRKNTPGGGKQHGSEN